MSRNPRLSQATLRALGNQYHERLRSLKNANPLTGAMWYPWASLGAIDTLDGFLGSDADKLRGLIGSSPVLDVGCGPASLMPLLRSNIQYYGIDIAIHDPAPNLIEADLLETPIWFNDKRFHIVVAQGVFEYFGTSQSQKFTEIRTLLADGGKFLSARRG